MYDYIIYTDGSCRKDNIGGWASVITTEDNMIVKTLYQGITNTTNNRAELYGVLETLKYFKTPMNLKIYSDSKYVVEGTDWAQRWFQEKDYSKKNLDLWFELLDLLKFHKVKLVWVKGHADNEFNNLADELAVHAAQCLNLPEDEIHSINI